MSKSRWVIAVAFGLIATLGAAQNQPAPENQPSQNESPTDRQDERGADQAQPVDITTVLERIESAIRDLKAEVDEVEQNRQRDASQRDLDAQEGMAWWAELMFYAASASVLLTAIALWAIIRTLHQTRRAAEASEGMLAEARATTDAANKSLAANSETTFNQLRPWVLPYKCEVSFRYLGIRGTGIMPQEVCIDVIWENAGQSPALDVGLFVKVIEVATGELPPTFEVTEIASTVVLGPKSKANTVQTIVDGQLAQRLMDGQVDCWIFSRSDYATRLGGGHRFSSEATFRVSFTGQKTRSHDTGDLVPVYNVLTEGPQNSAT